MRDFIEHLRAKPDHVRKQIALSASASITGVVALMWGTAFISSGALSRTNVPEEPGIVAAFSEEHGASLMGAIGALTSSKDSGELMVVGTNASSTVSGETKDERTVIPF